MLNKSFWILPCGINTGNDIVSCCGFSSAAQWYVWQAGSVNWVRVLRVNKWEALEFFLVQVGYKLLIWGGQLWGVACEKAIKVLSITPTLRWRKRDGERERGGERMAWIWWSEGSREKMETKQTKRKKRERQLKPTNQIRHSRDCGFPLVHMKANDISASSIGYYTHKWQVCICESSEQWRVMADERATLKLTSRIFLLWLQWERERASTRVSVCVRVSVMNTLTALGLKGGWTSLFSSFSQSI